ncbi:hypothetical protein F4818DRAFT_438226 [Hypoxylon cercidicola]|nr:hypothetical protein F4818DRAFT_438226 [Hypoxylon cercidicola]
MTAAHLVPHSLGNDTLIALFGTNVEGESGTPHDLLLTMDVKTAMDDGAITIAPNLPDDPSAQEVDIWESTGPKDYKWIIADPEAEILDDPLEVDPARSNIMTIGS